MLLLPTRIQKLWKSGSLGSEALRCFQNAIASVAERLVLTLPSHSSHIRSRLLALVASLDHDQDGEHLGVTAAEFDNILGEYQTLEQDVLEQRELTIRDTIGVLGSLLQKLKTREGQCSSDLTGILSDMEAVSGMDDLNAIHERLRRQARCLRACVQTLEEERLRNETDLLRHIDHLQQRLDDVERIASEDSLTGLTNRREAEAELQRYQADYAVFSVLFIDIGNLKTVNRTWGPAAGDQLLRLFANRLKHLMKPSDVVCRWGGEEFLIILKSSLPLARARCADLVVPLSVPYTLDGKDGPAVVCTQNLMGVAEHCTGDATDDLINRAHGDMHEANRSHMEAAALQASRN